MSIRISHQGHYATCYQIEGRKAIEPSSRSSTAMCLAHRDLCTSLLDRLCHRPQ